MPKSPCYPNHSSLVVLLAQSILVRALTISFHIRQILESIMANNHLPPTTTGSSKTQDDDSPVDQARDRPRTPDPQTSTCSALTPEIKLECQLESSSGAIAPIKDAGRPCGLLNGQNASNPAFNSDGKCFCFSLISRANSVALRMVEQALARYSDCSTAPIT